MEGMSWIDKLVFYAGFPFVRSAALVAVLISLCSALLGVVLVLRHYSYIGDGLSHVAFGALAAASVMKLANKNALTLPVTVICAVLMLRKGGRSRGGDSSVAMLSVGSLAVGYLLMNRFPTSSNTSGDVCTTLFGSTSILTLTTADVILCAVLSAVCVALFVYLYNRIVGVTFDESFAEASGTNVRLINLITAVLIAVIVVLAMNLVGSLLISALVVFPAMTAMRLFGGFRQVVICSACTAVICAVIGLGVSIVSGTPVGSTIVAADIAAYAVSFVVSKIRGEA